MKETIKTTCSSCEAQVSVTFDLPEQKAVIVKEKCQCGMSADYRSWRVGALVIVSVFILFIGSCITLELIELQKIKLIDPSKLKIQEQIDGFGHKSYRTVTKEEPKPDEKK